MTARKSSRRQARRSNMLTTHQSSRYPNPRPVVFDLVTTRRFETVIDYTSDEQAIAGTITVSDLLNIVPGGSALWEQVQFHRFDIYGMDHAAGGATIAYPVEATLNRIVSANGGFSDEPTFYSDGVSGARRAHVGIVPNDLYKACWQSTVSNTTVLLTVATPAWEETSPGPTYHFRVYLQFTCILRSTPDTFAPEAVVPATASSRLFTFFNKSKPIDNRTDDSKSRKDGHHDLVYDVVDGSTTPPDDHEPETGSTVSTTTVDGVDISVITKD